MGDQPLPAPHDLLVKGRRGQVAVDVSHVLDAVAFQGHVVGSAGYHERIVFRFEVHAQRGSWSPGLSRPFSALAGFRLGTRSRVGTGQKQRCSRDGLQGADRYSGCTGVWRCHGLCARVVLGEALSDWREKLAKRSLTLIVHAAQIARLR